MKTETDLKIEMGDTANYLCPCCGKKSETVHGFLYCPDGTTSVYFAGYTHGHPLRRANMVLSIGGWGEGTTPADRRAIALHATAEAGGPAFGFPAPETSPWFGKELLGAFRGASDLDATEQHAITTLAKAAVSLDPRVAAYFTNG